MMVGVLIVAGLTLVLPRGERVRTDCFRGRGGVVPTRVAWAEVTRTDEALVVWIGRRLQKGELPRARGSAHPPESMFDDGGETVELALAPRRDDPTLYYHFIANPSNAFYQARRRDGSWRPMRPVSSRVLVESDRWGVEFVVPYASLDVATPADGDSWRANFAVLTDNWAGLSDYHDTHQFGTLSFGAGDRRATVESVGLDDSGGLRVTYVIPPHQRKGAIPHKPVGEAFSLALGDGDRRLGTYDVRLPDATADAVALDAYYYPGGKRLTIACRMPYFQKATVRVRRLADGKVVESRGPMNVPGILEVDPLSPGDYALEMSDGTASATCSFEVLGAELPRRVDGPYYSVVGSEKLSSEGLSFKKALPQRFTRLHGVGYIYDPSLPLYGARDLLFGEKGGKELYRLAYEAQMAVLLQGNGERVPADVENRPAFYAEAYRELKREFPYLRFSIHVDSSARAAEFAQACDVFEYAAPGCSYAHDLLTNLREAVSSMQSYAAGRPTILWLGAAFPDNGKWRTAEELNSAVRYCILKGVSGNVLHLGHGGVPSSNTRLWSWMRQCERAVNAWYPRWVEGEEIPLSVIADSGVECGLRAKDGHSVLLAVNLDKRERMLRFTDPRSARERIIKLPGCGSLVLQEDR